MGGEAGRGDLFHMHGVARRRLRMIARSFRIASKFFGARRDALSIFGDADGVRPVVQWPSLLRGLGSIRGLLSRVVAESASCSFRVEEEAEIIITIIIIMITIIARQPSRREMSVRVSDLCHLGFCVVARMAECAPSWRRRATFVSVGDSKLHRRCLAV